MGGVEGAAGDGNNGGYGGVDEELGEDLGANGASSTGKEDLHYAGLVDRM